MQETQVIRTTEKSIGDTIYIVESMLSKSAKETAYIKLKRLITTNMKSPLMLTNSRDLYLNNHSTSSK